MHRSGQSLGKLDRCILRKGICWEINHCIAFCFEAFMILRVFLVYIPEALANLETIIDPRRNVLPKRKGMLKRLHEESSIYIYISFICRFFHHFLWFFFIFLFSSYRCMIFFYFYFFFFLKMYNFFFIFYRKSWSNARVFYFFLFYFFLSFYFL